MADRRNKISEMRMSGISTEAERLSDDDWLLDVEVDVEAEERKTRQRNWRRQPYLVVSG